MSLICNQLIHYLPLPKEINKFYGLYILKSEYIIEK